jgi:hypothetical protein
MGLDIGWENAVTFKAREETIVTLQIGTQLWIPCEVKPGPFSDERLVRVPSSRGDWLGFVPVHLLREPVLEGNTFVGARVVSVQGERFQASLPGEALTPSLFEGNLARVAPVDPHLRPAGDGARAAAL